MDEKKKDGKARNGNCKKIGCCCCQYETLNKNGPTITTTGT